MDTPVKQTVRERRLTKEEAAKLRKVRSEIEREKPEISARIRTRIAELADLASVFAELKKVRESKGLSLADVQQATGIDKASLSKLETGQRANFTLDTVLRYADAVGKQVQFALSEKSA